jgi:hypothetical protein
VKCRSHPIFWLISAMLIVMIVVTLALIAMVSAEWL